MCLSASARRHPSSAPSVSTTPAAGASLAADGGASLDVFPGGGLSAGFGCGGVCATVPVAAKNRARSAGFMETSSQILVEELEDAPPERKPHGRIRLDLMRLAGERQQLEAASGAEERIGELH